MVHWNGAVNAKLLNSFHLFQLQTLFQAVRLEIKNEGAKEM